MSKLRFMIAGLVLIVISIATPVHAQQTTGQQSTTGQIQAGTQTPGTQTPGQPGGQTPPVQTQRDQRSVNQNGQNGQNAAQQGVSVVEALAKKIKKSNEAEIELAQLAQEKVEDQGFRQFTQKLVQDHQQMNEQLDRLVSASGGGAGQRGNTGTTSGNLKEPGSTQSPAGQNGAGPSGVGQRGNANSDEAASTPAGQDGQNQAAAPGRQGRGQMGAMGGRVPQMLCTIMDEACDNNLEMTKKMLQEHDGQNFKMAFLGQQIVAHTACLAEMKAIESSGPEPLKSLAKQAAPKIQEHLDMAKQMAKKFEDDRGTEARSSDKDSGKDSK